jgi:transcriptional regulator with XRE-family HTH domain
MGQSPQGSSFTNEAASFGVFLRQWRAVRRLSQMDLALEAEISMRHLSCLETGRAQPSRQMVARLAEALQIPLRERNGMLLAAGYAPFYRQVALDSPDMEAARQAVEFLLSKQDPYPGLIVDKYANILQENDGAKRFFSLFPVGDAIRPRNGMRLLFHPKGLRPYIANWEEVAARLIQRVHREVATDPSDVAMKHLLHELLNYPGVPSRWRMQDLDGNSPPFLTIDYRPGRCTLRMFSTLTTFGTAQDIGLQQLRIESFFPADEPTRAALMP